MAGRTISQRIALEGGDEVRRQFQELGKQGADAFAQLEKAGRDIRFEKIGQSAKELGEGLKQVGSAGAQAGKQVQDAFSQTGATLNNAGEDASGFGARFATVAAGAVAGAAAIGLAFSAAISKMVEAGSTAASKLQDSADKLGVSATRLQELRNQIEVAGASVGVFESSLSRLGSAAASAGTQTAQAAEKLTGWVIRTVDGQKAAGSLAAAVESLGRGITRSSYEIDGATIKVTRFGQESKKLVDAAQGVAGVLQQLGINLQKFSTANADERLTMLREAFAKLPDDASKASAAAKLFGDNWREMLKVVSLTPDEIATANKALEDTGRKLTQSEIDNLTAYKSAKGELDASLEATRNKIAAIFAPGKTRTAEWLTELIDQNRKWLLDLAETKRLQIETFFNDTFGGGRAALTFVLEKLGSLARDFGQVLTSLVAPAIKLIAEGFSFAAEKINGLLGTNVSGQFLAIAVALGTATGAFGLFRAAIGAVVGVFGLVVTAIAGLRSALVAGGLGAAAFWAELRVGGLSALNAIRSALPALRAALAAAFRGDFATAFTILRQQAAAAFAAIRKAASDASTPIGQIFQSLQTGFRVLMATLSGAAAVLNAVFGTNLTAASLAFYTALLQISGVLGTIIPVIGGLALVLSRLGIGFVAVAAAGVIVYRLFGQLSQAWGKLTAGFSNLLSGDFAKGWEQLKAAASDFWNTLSSQSALTWAILAAGAAVAIGKIIALFAGIGPALAGLVGAVGAIGASLVTALSAGAGALAALVSWPALLVAAVAAAAVAIYVYWDEIKAAFIAAWEAMVAFASGAWDSIVQAASAAWEAIKSSASSLWTSISEAATNAWQAVVSGFQSAWEGLVGALRGMWDGFIGYVTSAMQGLSSLVSSIVSTIMSAISSIASAIASAASAAASLIPSGEGSGGPTYDFGGGFRSGGYISGPGTGTSDSILARLSNGEFVMRAAAVRKYGLALLQAINSGAFRLPKFAMGGPVDFGIPQMSFAPSFAMGDASGGSRVPVNIHLPGGQVVRVEARESALAELSRESAQQQRASLGRAPRWVGG
jgi:phage-related protein